MSASLPVLQGEGNRKPAGSETWPRTGDVGTACIPVPPYLFTGRLAPSLPPIPP